MAYWAYDFVCDQPIEALLASLNAAGPWRWGQRESGVFGDYSTPVRKRGFACACTSTRRWATTACSPGCATKAAPPCWKSTKPEIDSVFRGLLQIIAATDIIEIEPYD